MAGGYVVRRHMEFGSRIRAPHVGLRVVPHHRLGASKLFDPQAVQLHQLPGSVHLQAARPRRRTPLHL